MGNLTFNETDQFDLFCDRITAEDLEIFSRLKCWSAAPQIQGDSLDADIMRGLLAWPGDKSLKARVSIEANGGENF